MSNLVYFVVIILIFYIILLEFKYNTYMSFIQGFWISDPSFCEESNIQDMIFFIDNQNKTMKILIQQEDKNLENTTYDMKLCKILNSNNFTINSDCMEYKLKLTEHEKNNKKNNIMDGDYTLYLSLSKGIITLYKDDMVYAILYKDNMMSSKLL